MRRRLKTIALTCFTTTMLIAADMFSNAFHSNISIASLFVGVYFVGSTLLTEVFDR